METLTSHGTAWRCPELESNVRQLYELFPNFELATPVHKDLLCGTCKQVSVLAVTHPKRSDSNFRCTVCRLCRSDSRLPKQRVSECNICRISLDSLLEEDFSAEMGRVWVCCPADKWCDKLYPIGEMLDHVKKSHPREIPAHKQLDNEMIKREMDRVQEIIERSEKLQRDVKTVRDTQKLQEEIVHDIVHQLVNTKQDLHSSSNQLARGIITTTATAESHRKSKAKKSYQEDVSQLTPPHPFDYGHVASIPGTLTSAAPALYDDSKASFDPHSYERQSPFNPNYDLKCERHIPESERGDGADASYGVAAAGPVSSLVSKYDGLSESVPSGSSLSWQEHAIRIEDFACMRALQRENKFPFEDTFMLGGVEFRAEIYADGFPGLSDTFVSVRLRVLGPPPRASYIRVKLTLNVGTTRLTAKEGVLKIDKIENRSFVEFRKFIEQQRLQAAILEFRSCVVLTIFGDIKV